MKPAPRVAKPAPHDVSWLARWHPWLLGAMTALFVARPLWPSESAARSGDGLPVVMLWLLLAAIWLTLGVVEGHLFVRLRWVDGALAALVALQVIAALYSASHDAARPAINMLWEWIALGVAYFLARQLIHSVCQARGVAVAMIALAVSLSGHGLYQYFVALPQTRAEYEANPDELLRREGMWYPPGSLERDLFEQRLYSTEPLATFALTNSLAGFLTPWLVVIGGAAFTLRAGEQRLRTKLTAAVISFAAVAACLLLTKSRSGYAATALGLAASAAIVTRYRGRLNARLAGGIAALLVLLVGVLIASGGMDWEVLAEAPKSLGYRWQYWQASLLMIADHPWLGVGPGNFADHYTRYKLAAASEEIADPHNALLEIAATAGGLALAAMLIVVAGVLSCLVPRRTVGALDPTAPEMGDEPSARFALAGLGAGYLLALVLPLVSGAVIEVPLNIFTFGIGLLLAGATGLAWLPWLRTGGLPNWLSGAAWLAALINLLAAGGISYPAVAGSFWLLAAMTVTLRDIQPVGRTLRRPALVLFWALAVVAVVLCYTSAYQPVLAAANWSATASDAANHHNFEQADQYLERAARADRLASAPWSTLAELRMQVWQSQPTRANFDAYEQALLRAIAARPYQASLWLRLGDAYRDGYQALGERRLLETAVDGYRQAVKLYPHHARERAKLALALALANQREAARREADQAWRLDALTPHADQKLRPELRAELLQAGLSAPTGK
jgi:hypothetical protein